MPMFPNKITLAFLVSTVLSTTVLADAYQTKAKYALLMDSDTGYVMFDKKSDEPMHPASMTKLMTAYMVDEAVQAGKFKLDDEFEDYCSDDDYYQPVVEDFEAEHYAREWAEERGLELIRFEGSGSDGGYEPRFRKW